MAVFASLTTLVMYVQHQEHTFFHILINLKQDKMYHL